MTNQHSEFDAQLAELAAEQRRGRLKTIAVVGFVCSLPFLYIAAEYVLRWQESRAQLLPKAQQTQLSRILDQLEESRASAQTQWEAKSSETLLQKLTPSQTPCPIRLEPPTQGAASSYIEYGSIDGNYFGTWSLEVIAKGASLGSCPGCSLLSWSVSNWRKRLAAGTATFSDLKAAQRFDLSGSDYDVFVLTSEQKEGFASDDSFSPGLLAGRALLYSSRVGRFVCAGDFVASNSPAVKTRYRHMKDNFLDQQSKAAQAVQGALGRDLTVQVRTVIPKTLMMLDPVPEEIPHP